MSTEKKRVVEVQEKLEDITECPICTETYKEPKILPCIHTFCMICLQETGLKTEKSPGEKMPCPVCRTEFTVPEKGCVGLQRNFFMERLIEMKNILNPSSARAVCDACQEDNDLGDEAEIPSAEMYCVDCNQRLCGDCCRHHRKYKISKNHRMLPLDGAQINIPPNVKPYVCDKHENKPLEIYCSSCQETVCALCLYKSHKTHDTSPVIEVVTDFRRIIQENADSMMKYFLDLKQQRTGKVDDKEKFARKVTDVESEINRIRQDLQECTEKDCDSLLQQLNSIKEERNKENETRLSDIETVLASLESYQAFCTQVTAMGSDVDICRAVYNLNTRAVELKQRYESVSLELFPDIWLKKSEFPDVLYQTGNIIGKIEGDQTKAPFEAQSAPSESGSWFTRSVDYSEMKNCDETEDSNIEDSKESISDAMKEQLVDKVKELEQELESMKHKELEREGVEKSLRKYKPTPRFIKGIQRTMASTGCITVTGLTILDNELFIATKESKDIEVYDSTIYAFKRLWRVSELTDPWDMCSCSTRKCLYIASGYAYKEQMRFNVDDTVDFGENLKSNYGRILRVDKIGNMLHSWDIGCDYGTLSITGESNIIFSVPAGSKIVEYDADGECLREINISTDNNLKVLSLSDRTDLNYTICPIHAEKLSNGYFVVSYFVFEEETKSEPLSQENKFSLGLSKYSKIRSKTYSSVSGLCMINPEGKMITVISGNPESEIMTDISGKPEGEMIGLDEFFGYGELCEPWYLAVDKDMTLLVLERSSERISLLSPNLKYKRKVVSKKHGLSDPYRICLDETNRRLLVAKRYSKKDHVLVYEIKDP